MYQKLGFYAPFIFGIILTVVDLIGRLLIVERKDAMKWGVDPWEDTKTQKPVGEAPASDPERMIELPAVPASAIPEITEQPVGSPNRTPPASVTNQDVTSEDNKSHKPVLTSWGVLRALAKSPRAVASITMTLVYGYAQTLCSTTRCLKLTLMFYNIGSS